MTKLEQKIPEGWSVKKLGDIAKLERGKFSIRPRNDPSCYGGNIPFVQTGDVTRAGIYLKEFSQTLNDKGLSVSKLFPANAILITIAANIGETAITTFPVCCPDSLVAITGNKSNLIWLNYMLETHKNELNTLATQNAQKNINLETLKPLKILTPPLAEQEKIAEILSRWDDGIEKLSALIEKKKIQKKALMQQLLTGKHRLKGFSTPWHEVKLGDVLKERCEYTTTNNQFPILTSSRKGIFKQEEYFDKQVASENNIGYKIIKQHDFTYRAMTDDDIFCFNELIDENIGAVSPAYSVFYCSSISNVLLDAILNSKRFRANLIKVAQGGTRKSLKFSSLIKLKIFIPSDLAEQKAIAEILSKADEEIELLNKKLEAFKQEKKALMQQLLTGKIRVKVN